MMHDPTHRVLLTGASGFLGSHMLGYLLGATDWTIVCPVSFRHRGVPERITHFMGKNRERVEVIYCDLSCPITDTTAKLFGDIGYIINFASESHVPRAIAEPVPFVQNNINLMLYLLEYARTLSKLDAFVQLSTDEVYGPAVMNAHEEWSPTLPSTPYSASKAAQEALAGSYWRTYDVPLIIVNTMNPIGVTQDPEKFLPLIIHKIMHNEVIQIHASDGVIGSRMYTWAGNLVDAIWWLMREVTGRSLYFNTAGDRPSRWNVAGERDVSNLELATLVASYLDKPLRYELVNAHHPSHGQRFALDTSKITDAGWRPSISFETALKEIVEWTSYNPLWNERVAQ